MNETNRASTTTEGEDACLGSEKNLQELKFRYLFLKSWSTPGDSIPVPPYLSPKHSQMKKHLTEVNCNRLKKKKCMQLFFKKHIATSIVGRTGAHTKDSSSNKALLKG